MERKQFVFCEHVFRFSAIELRVDPRTRGREEAKGEREDSSPFTNWHHIAIIFNK